MKFIYFFFYLVNCEKIIRNINLPSCKNCIHFKSDTIYADFTNNYNRCDKFGNKDLITDEITYDLVETCRNDENLCGNNGKYFEKEKNLQLKIFKHKIINIFPSVFLGSSILFVYILSFNYSVK